MPIDLASYKPSPEEPGDANQIANGFTAIEDYLNAFGPAAADVVQAGQVTAAWDEGDVTVVFPAAFPVPPVVTGSIANNAPGFFNPKNITETGFDLHVGWIAPVGTQTAYWFAHLDSEDVAPSNDTTGTAKVADLDFVEPDAPSDDLVAVFAVPVGATVTKIELIPVAGPWADSVTLNVGDDDSATYFFNAVVAGDLTTYDPAAVVLSTNFETVLGSNTGDGTNAEFDDAPGKLYPSGGTITATMTGIDTGGDDARLRVRIYYVTASPTVLAAVA